MTLFDLDPDTVKAGWIPLALVALVGLALVGLFFSLRARLRGAQALPTRAEVAADEARARAAASVGKASPPTPGPRGARPGGEADGGQNRPG